MYKTYDQVTDDELTAMAKEWLTDNYDGWSISRYLVLALMERGYDWDHTLTDDQNRDRFNEIVAKVHTEAKKITA